MHIPLFFRRSELASTFWAFRRELAVCVLFGMAANLLMLAPTLYMLQVYDRVMVSRNGMTLIAMTLVVLFLFALLAFADWCRSRLLVRAGLKLEARMISRVLGASFEAQLKQSSPFPQRALPDFTLLRQFLSGNGLVTFVDLPWAPIHIAVLYLLHPWLGGLALIFAAMLAGLAWLSHRLGFAAIEGASNAGQEAHAYVEGKLRNLDTIEALGMRADLRRRWQRLHQGHLALNARAQGQGSRIQAIIRFVRHSQQSLILGAGALLVIEGTLTPGAMIAASVLMARALQPVETMVDSWKSFVGARAAFLRLEALLARHPEPAAGAIHRHPEGHLRLQELVATAPGRESPVLKGLTANFPAGGLVAITGPSGSGKSTLARVLVGVWPDTEGLVLLDGEPLPGWNREELGRHVGYLPQDIELFEGSIAENIARFGPIDAEQVIRAARRAGIHDVILRFPRGYETPMGEAGHLLSGGQRQRIALARAMYGEPCLIVLDEPDSNLDDAGEAALFRALKDMKVEGKTVFLITHRMNIIGAADLVLVLRDGSIQHYGPLPQTGTAPAGRPVSHTL